MQEGSGDLNNVVKRTIGIRFDHLWWNEKVMIRLWVKIDV